MAFFVMIYSIASLGVTLAALMHWPRLPDDRRSTPR
jgi:hypothetical protein